MFKNIFTWLPSIRPFAPKNCDCIESRTKDIGIFVVTTIRGCIVWLEPGHLNFCPTHKTPQKGNFTIFELAILKAGSRLICNPESGANKSDFNARQKTKKYSLVSSQF